jgi:predicted Rossmann fold flavoprotein
MDCYDVVIIGAGPAGLLCGILCGTKGRSVCILEKGDSAGKKLLLSGSGKCNITHAGSIKDFLAHYGDKGRFVKPSLFNFTNADLMDFFEKRRLKTAEASDGKIFPETQSGRDVLGVLLEECEKKGVVIRTREPVQDLAKTPSGFEARTKNAAFRAGTAVIAAGGASYPSTGSSGDGYALAEVLGHTIVEPGPALAPVIVRNYSFGNCAGISLADTKTAVYRDNKKVRDGRGDVLFTHRGLSGPGILDLSRYIRRNDELKVSLLKFDTKEDFEKDLIEEFSAEGKRKIKKCMSKYKVPQRVLERVFYLKGIPLDQNTASIDKKTRRLIVDNLMECPFVVENLGGYDEAMVTRGGVCCREINPNTMESRIIPGLYFAGEVVDVDGDCGGYNLQFAFSSGILSAKSIAESRRPD